MSRKKYNDWKIIFQEFKSLYMSSFNWINVPDTINTRYLELQLFETGRVVFFNDEDLGVLALQGTQVGGLDVYYEPVQVHVIGGNGYSNTLKNKSECIIVWDNSSRTIPKSKLIRLAQRIADIEKTIDINVYGQRTPLIVKTSKKQELTVKNLLTDYDNFRPVVVVDDDFGNEKIKAIRTDTPYVVDKLEEEKRKLWNEALSFIGIENNFSEKSERLTQNEVLVSNGLAIAKRTDRRKCREDSLIKINELFELDIVIELNNLSVLDFELDNIESEVLENE